jgi:predicted unusual protein kinase regulating ubiquinone biosynthesis (AarF/ABC1/UbiB family)/CBS domain-containing protein
MALTAETPPAGSSRAVEEVMERRPVVLTPDETLTDVARALHDHRASGALVIDSTGLLGIITERDLVRAVVDGLDPATTTVAGRMSTEVVTVPPDADVARAVTLMVEHGFRHLPVVEGGEVLGLLTLDARLAAGPVARRPVSDFGTVGTISRFRGPFADGPPADALRVEVPPLQSFGLAELRRMIVIYAVLLVSVGAALLRRAFRPGRGTWFDAGSSGAVDGFIRLGPTFVKLGQLMASSPGLFPAPLAGAARRCLDEVPPFPASDVRRMIREDLGRPPNQIFRSFDDTPLSAASIGQVHACTLPDGRDAVVKLQRPGIRARMTTDLRIMFRLARLFEKTRWGRSANATGAIADLHAVTFQELNPAVEAWRQHRFRERIGAFGDNEWITAPEVYWEYCGPRMICMERVSGIPMDDFETIRERGIDGQLVLRRGAKVWAEAVMVHGPFHGDMHAGNIWVLDDGRGCYLDFGIMGELTEDWRQVVRDIFYACTFDLDFTRVAAAYRRVGVFPPDAGTDEEIGQRMGMMIGPLLNAGIAAVSLGDLITSSVDLMRSYQGTAPSEMMLIGKQLLYIERYTKVLAPDYAIIEDPFIVKNVFPEAAAKKAADLGVTFPD